ncbi:hemagglutinin repeat-containing protein [Pseudomonas sp. KNUC1026]|nr:hemagglutinin repeat-containing protein [Pseudomonas sp. KNUC1026]
MAGNLAEGKPSNSSGSLIKLGTELANTRQRTQQESVEDVAKPATLISGGKLEIIAERDLEVVGSRLRGTDTDLLAGRDIRFESAQHRSAWNNQSTSDKAAIGASFNIGEQTGFTLDLGASVGKAQGRGSQVEQANAQLHTGTLNWHSGRHSQLAGAEIHAERIDARVGRDLLIVSRQDELHREQRQRSAGAVASLCIPPSRHGATVSASGSLAYADSTTLYEGVVNQSGLFAGQGGFGIDVGGTTDLQGAVIDSQAPPERNRLSTERLAFSDIRNRSETTARSASLSASYSSSGTLADKKRRWRPTAASVAAYRWR